MRMRIHSLILIIIFYGIVFSKSAIVSHPPQMLSVLPTNDGAKIEWKLDLPDTVFSYNDGYPSGVWDPHMKQALGVILDLSAYPGATLEQIDFVHWGREKIHGPYYYNILFFDMDSSKLFYRIDSLQAGDAYEFPRFEVGVPLGSVPARNRVGIFVEGLSSFDGTHAFPAIMSDTSAYVPGVSYYLADVDDPFYAADDNYTNFFELKEVTSQATNLIFDVWINFNGNKVLVSSGNSSSNTIRSNPNTPKNVYLGRAPENVSENVRNATDDRILKGFYIYRGASIDDSLIKIADVGADVREFIDATTMAESTYAYGVATYNATSISKQMIKSYYQPPILTIPQARADADQNFIPDLLDKIVAVRGTVISPNFSNHFQYFISGNDGGIQLYASNFSLDLSIGDSVFVVGHIAQYKGLTELKVDSVELVQSLGTHSVDTLKTTLDEINENLEGRLVEIDNLEIVNPGEWPAYGQNKSVTVTDGSNSMSVFIDKDTDLDGWTPPAGKFNLVAIVDQYTSSNPANDGYQLRPRSQQDFISATALDGSQNTVALSFKLKPCYPNPFNPKTTIEYQIARQSHVLLQIFNIQGQKVGELKNEVQSPGSYKVTFNAQSLSSGIYFVRLKAGTFEKEQKIILLK